MKVTITGRSADRLEQARRGLAGNVEISAFDGARTDEVRRVLSALGAFDHLVLCLSGGTGLGPSPRSILGIPAGTTMHRKSPSLAHLHVGIFGPG